MDFLTQYFTALLVTGIINGSLGLFVILKGPKNRLNQVLALYSLSLFVWSIFEALGIASNNESLALLLWRVNHVGVIFIPVFLVHFVFLLLDIKGRKRRLIPISYAVACIFLILDATPLLILEVVPKFSFRYFINPGHLYYIFFWMWVSWAVYGNFELFKEFFKTSGYRKNQMQYFCWSLLFSYIGGAPNFFPTFNIEIPILMPFGTYAIPLYTFATAYAIFRYRFMDIKVALTRAGIFAIVYILVLGIPLGLAGWGKYWLLGLFGQNWYWAPIILAILFATAGPFILISLTHQAEKRLLAEENRARELLKQASDGMLRIRNLKRLLSLMVHVTCKILKLDNAAMFLLDEETGKYKLVSVRLRSKYRYSESLDKNDALVQRLARTQESLVYEEVKLKSQELKEQSGDPIHEIASQMQELSSAVIIPAACWGRLLGFLVLGAKKSKRVYSKEDLNVLQVLSNQAALAIENALFWQKEEQRVVESSREEATSAAAFGAGHQFNNRLYAISVATDYILEHLKAKDPEQASPEELKGLLKKIVTKLQKISEECQFGGQITAGIMSLAGSAAPNFKEFDICAMINSSIELAEMKHAQDKIKENRPSVSIINHVNGSLPCIFGSDAQIRDCLFNLIDNAFDAVYEKYDTLKKNDPELNNSQNQAYAPQIEVKASIQDNYLHLAVSDNGIGIKEEDKKRLFGGFFTTKPTSVKGYGKGGHGIGIFTVRKLILAHKGRISFASEYGQGATFTIELPLAKDKVT